MGSGVGQLWGWADAVEMLPRARGGWEPAAPQLFPARSLVAAAAEKETHILSGGRFGKSKTEAAGSGWAPKQTAHRSSSRSRCKDTHLHRRGCPGDGTVGAAALALQPRCWAGLGQQQRCSLMHYPRKSAIFAGEEFFLIGPHGDIRAISKEV